jgi:hypothetical protein
LIIWTRYMLLGLNINNNNKDYHNIYFQILQHFENCEIGFRGLFPVREMLISRTVAHKCIQE